MRADILRSTLEMKLSLSGEEAYVMFHRQGKQMLCAAEQHEEYSAQPVQYS